MATLGEKRVRASFNPSGHDLVDEIKRRSAELIDLCANAASNGWREESNKDGETARLWALAMTHYEDAAMWAVKAATG